MLTVALQVRYVHHHPVYINFFGQAIIILTLQNALHFLRILNGRIYHAYLLALHQYLVIVGGYLLYYLLFCKLLAEFVKFFGGPGCVKPGKDRFVEQGLRQRQACIGIPFLPKGNQDCFVGVRVGAKNVWQGA